jgi:hypothetical protein
MIRGQPVPEFLNLYKPDYLDFITGFDIEIIRIGRKLLQ